MIGLILTLWMGLLVFVSLIGLLVWSCKGGQWEDLDVQAEKILWDEKKDE